MIYITHTHSIIDDSTSIKAVYDSPIDNAKERYKKFMISESEKQGIVINPHWLMMMNHENHHPTLSKEEYKQKNKTWCKFSKSWTFDKFLTEHCKAVKQPYYTSY